MKQVHHGWSCVNVLTTHSLQCTKGGKYSSDYSFDFISWFLDVQFWLVCEKYFVIVVPGFSFIGIPSFYDTDSWQLRVCVYTISSHRHSYIVKFSGSCFSLYVLCDECIELGTKTTLEKIHDTISDCTISIWFSVCIYRVQVSWFLHLFNILWISYVGFIFKFLLSRLH